LLNAELSRSSLDLIGLDLSFRHVRLSCRSGILADTSVISECGKVFSPGRCRQLLMPIARFDAGGNLKNGELFVFLHGYQIVVLHINAVLAGEAFMCSLD